MYLRPRKDGPFLIRCLARGDKRKPLSIEVKKSTGSTINQTSVQAKLDGIADFEIELNVLDVKAGEVIKLVARKGDKARFSVVSDAALVHYLPLNQPHVHESLNGSQNATPEQLVTRTSHETMSYYDRTRQPFTLRDAQTGSLIFRPQVFTEAEASVKTGANRMIIIIIIITTAGCRAPDEWKAKGVEPYFSDSLENWFHPAECGWREP